MSSVRLAALVAIATLAAACGAPNGDDIAASANAADEVAPTVPVQIEVPAGNTLAFDLVASGVQIYDCKATAAGGFAWVFRAPSATLYNPGGEAMAIHYAGPTWQSTKDDSLVVGAKVAAYTPDPTAIPWLLLRAVSHDGHGRFGAVTYVQRLLTTGGNAPASGCDADHLGGVANVDYTATYFFYQSAD